MFENDDAPLRARLAFADLDHFSLRGDGVADEDRLGKLGAVETEVADGGAERGIADRETDHEAQRENTVDQALAELGVLREFRLHLQTWRTESQVSEQQR